MWRSSTRVDNGVYPCDANTARTLHAPEGMGACNEASGQGHTLKHLEELSCNNVQESGGIGVKGALLGRNGRRSEAV